MCWKATRWNIKKAQAAYSHSLEKRVTASMEKDTRFQWNRAQAVPEVSILCMTVVGGWVEGGLEVVVS